MSTWWGQYVGLPFEQAHCWGLVRRVYKEQLGVDLPSYGEISACELHRIARKIAVEKHNGPWQRVDAPKAFDVVLMRGRKDIYHVGIMVDDERILHTERATDAVVVSRHDTRVRGRVSEFWRYTP